VRCSARQVRRRQGLSLEEVGRRAGYSHRAVSMVELGQWPDPRLSLASISTVPQNLHHPQSAFANPPGKLGMRGRAVSPVHY